MCNSILMLFRKHCFGVLSLPNFRVHLRRGSRKIVLHSCFIYLFIYVSYLCIYCIWLYIILYIYILNIYCIFIFIYILYFLGTKKTYTYSWKRSWKRCYSNPFLSQLSFIWELCYHLQAWVSNCLINWFGQRLNSFSLFLTISLGYSIFSHWFVLSMYALYYQTLGMGFYDHLSLSIR